MWFKWVLFSVFVLTCLASLRTASRGKHEMTMTPGAQAVGAMVYGLLAVGALVYL